MLAKRGGALRVDGGRRRLVHRHRGRGGRHGGVGATLHDGAVTGRGLQVRERVAGTAAAVGKVNEAVAGVGLVAQHRAGVAAERERAGVKARAHRGSGRA